MNQLLCIKCKKPLLGRQKRFCSLKCNKAYFALKNYRNAQITTQKEFKTVSHADGQYVEVLPKRRERMKIREKQIFDAPLMHFSADRESIQEICRTEMIPGDELIVEYYMFRVAKTSLSKKYLFRTIMRVRPSPEAMMAIQHGGNRITNTWWERKYSKWRELNKSKNQVDIDKDKKIQDELLTRKNEYKENKTLELIKRPNAT